MGTSITPAGVSSAVKSFWQRPEGTTGKALLGILGLGAALGIALNITAILGFIFNVYILIGSLVGLYIIYLILSSKRFSTMLFYALQSVSRAITSIWVEYDPISIIEGYVRKLEEWADVVRESVDGIRGADQTLASEMDRCQREARDFRMKADAAIEKQDLHGAETMTELMGARQATYERYNLQRQDIQETLAILLDVQSVVNRKVVKAKDEARELRRQKQVGEKIGAATRNARNVLGNNDFFAVQNMAVDSIRERYDAEVGAMRSLATEVQGLKKEVELGSLVDQQRGRAGLSPEKRKQLEALRNRLETAGEPQLQLGAGSAPAQPIRATARLLTGQEANGVTPTSGDTDDFWSQTLRKK